MANEFDEEKLSTGSTATGIVAMILPFATAIAALALGAILGIAIGWVSKPNVVVEKPVMRDPTAAEIQAACTPQIETKVTELEAAQTKISFLEKEVADRDARVKELEARAPSSGGGGGGGRNLAAELAQAKKDLEEARSQLDIARAEKEQLVVELTQTKEQLQQTEVALAAQVEKTETAKEDALVNKWYRFVNDAQLEICEKGNRKKMGNCRDAVLTALSSTDRQNKFAHCIRSAQAQPVVHERQGNADLPDFSEMLNEEEKLVKGWYVEFCDPTLPERDDAPLSAGHLPSDGSPG